MVAAWLLGFFLGGHQHAGGWLARWLPGPLSSTVKAVQARAALDAALIELQWWRVMGQRLSHWAGAARAAWQGVAGLLASPAAEGILRTMG